MLTRRHFLELSATVPAVFTLSSLPHDSEAPAAVGLPQAPQLLSWQPPDQPSFTGDDLPWFVERAPNANREDYHTKIQRTLEVYNRCERYSQWYWAREMARRFPFCRLTRRPDYFPELQTFETTDYVTSGDILNRRAVDVDEVRSWWARNFSDHVTFFLRSGMDNMLDYLDAEILPKLRSYRRRQRVSGMVMAVTPPLWVCLRDGYTLCTTSRMTYGTACHDLARP